MFCDLEEMELCYHFNESFNIAWENKGDITHHKLLAKKSRSARVLISG